ncbi:MAG: D-alanyl-D-alanine carboxypeptidase [Hyphomicrobiaceae bacterium]|nr:D-alanyl-D-alanine carboxypeptidase [Hyphomicrobiaceae bacterium]
MRAGVIASSLLALMLLPNGAAHAGPALLFESSSGKVLYAEDVDNLWHPASLTKIMTAYITFEAIREGKLKLDDKIVNSEVAAKEPPSKIGLPVGAEISVELALKALIVKSANDVAVMLAEAIGGNVDGFVERMNATARRLGMTRTTFVNPNGLPADAQVTTARDLAKLARAVVRDFPQYSELWSMPDFHMGKRRLASHNSLLRSFEGADGLKTGFICDSGFNVVASATRDGTRLMAVVLGEPSSGERTVRAASLLEHGFQHYGWKTFFNATSLDDLPLDKDAKSVVSIRDSVVSWGCGNGSKATAASKARRLKARAARTKLRRKSGAATQSAKKTNAPAEATTKSGATKEASTLSAEKPSATKKAN